MKKFIAVAACILAGCGPAGSQIYAACDDAVKRTLRSPSSYARVDQALTVSDVNEDVFFLYRDINEEDRRQTYRRIWENSPPIFKKFRVAVRYDAQNAFGATVRGSFVCEFYSDDGSDHKATSTTVVLDGKTLRDRMSEAASQ
ncbi:MAG: hypothetical protein ACRCSX_02680 [Allorhizobium sp.]